MIIQYTYMYGSLHLMEMFICHWSDLPKCMLGSVQGVVSYSLSPTAPWAVLPSCPQGEWQNVTHTLLRELMISVCVCLCVCVRVCEGVRQLNEPVIITHTFRDRFTLYKAFTAQHITLSMYVNLSPKCVCRSLCVCVCAQMINLSLEIHTQYLYREHTHHSQRFLKVGMSLSPSNTSLIEVRSKAHSQNRVITLGLPNRSHYLFTGPWIKSTLNVTLKGTIHLNTDYTHCHENSC